MLELRTPRLGTPLSLQRAGWWVRGVMEPPPTMLMADRPPGVCLAGNIKLFESLSEPFGGLRWLQSIEGSRAA